MNTPIDLYFWPTPNGWKISIALYEFDLPFKTHLINIGAGDQFAPDFLKIAPNNRMPAIMDHDGPDNAPISVFESGAILQYLAEKTGRFGGETARERVAVNEWLMWQMGGLGPMAGQAHHFLKYAPAMDPPNDLPYAKDRYRAETARLYGVLDRRLAENEYVAGDFYSIADMSIWGWGVIVGRSATNIGGQTAYGALAGNDVIASRCSGRARVICRKARGFQKRHRSTGQTVQTKLRFV